MEQSFDRSTVSGEVAFQSAYNDYRREQYITSCSSDYVCSHMDVICLLS